MNPTPHIEVKEENVIAPIVLMPGDPLRAKFLADTYLTDVVCFNKIRNMFGFTGYYKGVRLSVMGSGMGMPSIGIYSYELFTNYGVETIIRIGSAGAYTADLDLFDVVLVEAAYSESTYALTQSGETRDTLPANAELNKVISATAEKMQLPLHKVITHSSDVFYREVSCDKTLPQEKGVSCVEMESFALFHNANVLGKKAACILTISDSFVNHKVTTSEERRTSVRQMMELALETVVELSK